MKKRSLLLILALTISLAIPLFLTQTQPVYTQPMTHTYTFTETIPTNIEVNFTVTIDNGILIEGNVAGWFLRINAASSNSTLQNITVNSDSHGTQISRGIMFPLSNAFTSDANMIKLPLPPPNYNFTLMKYENALLLQNVAGIPSQISFNLSVTMENITGGSETVYLASDVPVVSLVLPNPSTAPPVINYYLLVSILMAFLLPTTLILTDRLLKIRRLKKESAEGV